MCQTWIGQMLYHKKNENLVQERTGIGSRGRMTPISGVYQQRRSISPLLLAFFFLPGKQRPPRSDHSAFTVNKNANSPSAQRLAEHREKIKTSADTVQEYIYLYLYDYGAWRTCVGQYRRAKWWQQENKPGSAESSIICASDGGRQSGVEPLSGGGGCCHQPSP